MVLRIILIIVLIIILIINSIEINTNNEVINMNDFCLIDEKLNETEVNYTMIEDHPAQH